MRRIALLIACIAVQDSGLSTLAARADEPNVSSLVGQWQSAPVRLVRGDIDETYVFHVRLAGEQGHVMDIEYASTHAPADRRLIRQDVTLEADASSGRTIIVGANPRLVSGPAIIGVYEPDSLYCDTANRASADHLSCTWGSDAHGNAPEVELSRN